MNSLHNLNRLWVASWSLAAMIALPAAAQQKGGGAKQEDKDYDRIVEDFIQWDIGNVRDPQQADRIRSRFGGLKSDEAVPALVAGLNKSARMRASCPITALAGKLRGIMQASKDPQIGSYVLQNLEKREVPGYTQHINGVFDSAEQQIVRLKKGDAQSKQWAKRGEDDQQRLAYSPGMKLTDLPARDAGATRSRSDAAAAFAKLGLAELFERLSDAKSAAGALDELGRRAATASDARAITDRADDITKLLKANDTTTREAAARLIGLLRVTSAVPRLIDTLEDSNAGVRSAAATALARTTRQSFGPAEYASEAGTRAAIAKWRDWLAKQNSAAAP